jgi:hypothetical protein
LLTYFFDDVEGVNSKDSDSKERIGGEGVGLLGDSGGVDEQLSISTLSNINLLVAFEAEVGNIVGFGEQGWLSVLETPAE